MVKAFTPFLSNSLFAYLGWGDHQLSTDELKGEKQRDKFGNVAWGQIMDSLYVY